MASGWCTACRRDFTGLTPFDAHQLWDYEVDPPKLTCLDPAEIGMVKDKHGRWATGDAQAYTPASERPAREFERDCVSCGKVFERPRGRGRPPTKCPKCRGVK